MRQWWQVTHSYHHSNTVGFTPPHERLHAFTATSLLPPHPWQPQTTVRSTFLGSHRNRSRSTYPTTSGISVSALPRSVHALISGLFQTSLLWTALFILIRHVPPTNLSLMKTGCACRFVLTPFCSYCKVADARGNAQLQVQTWPSERSSILLCLPKE